MVFSRVAIVLFSVFALQPVWAVNKCTNANGEMVFQDLPCTGKGEAIKNLPSSASDTSTDAVAKMNDATKARKWRESVNQAIMRREPLVGMTRKELDEAMGAPTTVNASNYSGVLKDQIIYRQPTQTWYVYTEQWVVTSIQNTPAVASATAPKAACLSPFKIREMETSASSITLSDAERVERLRQIAEARKCSQ